ncbi:hypothetical protein [Streptomyces sp. NPDC001658]
MADNDAPAEGEGSTPDDDSFEVEMEVVEALPGGRAVMPVERKGKFVWLVVDGHVSHQARTEMVADLNHIVRSGLWQQNWQPPQADS